MLKNQRTLKLDEPVEEKKKAEMQLLKCLRRQSYCWESKKSQEFGI